MYANSLLWINFQQFKVLKSVAGDFELAVLYGRLKFQVRHSKITKDGKKVIARTRSQIAAYIGKGLTVTDEKLKSLVRLGLINIKVGMWKGKKRMFVSCNGDYDLGINARKLEMMNKYTGSIHLSVLLAIFAYWIEVKPLHADRANWAMVSRQSCADILGVDKKTIDIYVKELADKGLIRYEVKRFFQQRQYWVTVNDDFKKKIMQEYREEQEQIEEAKAEGNYFRVSEKTEVSIRINKNHQEDIKNNNTITNSVSSNTPLVDEKGNVILSQRQQNYLTEAIKRTLARCEVLTWSATTLMGHMRYVLGTPKNRESGRSFAHVINQAMFLVRNGLWKEPKGYLFYSEEGRKMREENEPKNPAQNFTVRGSGTIMMWNYGDVENDKTPPLVDIYTERNRLEGLGLPMDEVNQALLAKFGEHARMHLLCKHIPPVSTKRNTWRSNCPDYEELAKTGPVMRRILESGV